MYAYDAFHRHGGPSATPIYDALYAEYVRSFRSLPGDRSGEEELGFTAFRSIPRGRSGYSAYSAGAQSARVGQQSVWQRVSGTHVPAALPPAPRSGT
ncbi:hypothetical protein EV562_10735 [Streptomyces sp. BK208]|uniref:hypothetical protein n=1 Tax=Streptomyces sp. BK208 TaxID=2512150 RepID=UPI0010602070|nr:hypothetical protein [Streptomyces sp. BK208]TDT36573.1 hypothetical protein EV562_10735 [Streptomyces sp. BK208]